uniref:Uncharacterized protein LOC111113590 n=1 Tax=Crassostrea virginica TaxID=6565 RepID=A0A8B8BW47_CRAVI|nr:uncharacterized protein LOC111113590 [Crassostrea virginica]
MRSQVIVNCTVQARYVIYYNSRFKAFPHSPEYSTFANLDLCEVEVYENMALFRHTDAKYAYSDSIGSGKVVDGKKAKLYYGGGECFFSRNQQAFAFFYVDLDYIRGIERVIVYHRQEQDPWGCPVPVENLPTCYNHCPKNCECHEGTGACKRCSEGYEGENCELEKVPFLKHCG